jgi:hypothetical protein
MHLSIVIAVISCKVFNPTLHKKSKKNYQIFQPKKEQFPTAIIQKTKTSLQSMRKANTIEPISSL